MESKCREEHKGVKVWRVEGILHRENDLPAIEGIDGYKCWYINGKLHRINGPAAIYPDRTEFWYLEGKQQKNPNVLSLAEFLDFCKKLNNYGK